MKFLTIFSLATAVLADSIWYDAAKDITCTGTSSTGGIACEAGRIGDAQEITPNDLASRGLGDLEKRVSCSITMGPVDACFAHCFALNYCNAYCDDVNTCHCRCYDNSGICVNTSCS